LAFSKQGYLTKQGGSEGGRKSWKERYFVLNPDKTPALSYYRDMKDFLVSYFSFSSFFLSFSLSLFLIVELMKLFYFG
jgi:hypothetical protein